MTGNVSEWVWDLYSALPASRDLIKEDRCTAERGCRQLRGGSWGSGPDHARIGNIAASLPGEPVIGAGLRLARDISKTRSLP
jgi:formylglycine-generating enzyme required for sulfatase activity